MVVGLGWTHVPATAGARVGVTDTEGDRGGERDADVAVRGGGLGARGRGGGPYGKGGAATFVGCVPRGAPPALSWPTQRISRGRRPRPRPRRPARLRRSPGARPGGDGGPSRALREPASRSPSPSGGLPTLPTSHLALPGCPRWRKSTPRVRPPLRASRSRGPSGPRGRPARAPLGSRHEPRSPCPAGRRRRLAPRSHRQSVPVGGTRACPGPTTSSRVFTDSDRPPTVLRNLGTLFGQDASAAPGISRSSRSTRASSTRRRQLLQNPAYFDPANIVWLALAGGATRWRPRSATLGFGRAAIRHRIPFIVKLNHNQFLHYPNTYDQILFAPCNRPSIWGASGVGATIYFGSDDADREPGDLPVLRRGAPARDVHRAVVLPAQRRL